MLLFVFMDAFVSAVVRYPVKGLGGEVLDVARVLPGAGVAFDRRFMLAIVDDHSSLYDDEQSWKPWQYCLTLKKHEAIARLRAAVDETSGGLMLTITADDGTPQTSGVAKSAAIDEDGNGDFEDINRWLRELIDEPRINVQTCRKPAWDERDMPVSIVNEDTVAEFASRCGGEVANMTTARFRANIVVRRMPPWSEHSAEHISIGDARFRVLADIPRCAATQVNPQTARRDAKVPSLLHQHYGHNHLGVYADPLSAVDVKTGDVVL